MTVIIGMLSCQGSAEYAQHAHSINNEKLKEEGNI
jgi:hypothetical protein